MGGGDSSDLEAVDVHHVLSNERRRIVLQRLRAAGETMSARDLSEHIAERETGESPPPRNIRQSAYVSLHQSHLPKLDDLGIVEYDESEKTVTLDEAASREVETYMRTDPDHGFPWREYQLGLSVLGLVLLTATRLDLPMVASIPDTVCMGAILVLIAAPAVHQTVTGDGSILHRFGAADSGQSGEDSGETGVE